jgi:hypothetical protein
MNRYNTYFDLRFELGSIRKFFKTFDQRCGSGSGLDPDSATLWIRIRDPDSQYGSGSRGKKIKKFHWKNALFSYFYQKFYH